MKKIIIIGNGIAGITAARHIRKLSNDDITVISGESEHFFSRTALMYIYMGHMRFEDTKPYQDWFWEKNRIDLIKDWVTSIDFQKKTLKLQSSDDMSYDKLVIATGSTPNKFGWPGQDLDGVQGLYSLQDLELMEKNSNQLQRAVIVGGGLIGVEMAEMLHSRGVSVTFLIREKNFWDNVLPLEEASMIDRHLLKQHIDLRQETELDEIIGDDSGKVIAVKTKEGEDIPCGFVGLTVGVRPNTDWLKDAEIETDRGILVDDFLQTSIEDVYAIGDCAQLRNPLSHRRSIEAVWYAGRMMGETVAHTLTGKKTSYQPGVWFNSAKFFDIEYQTYGKVTPQPETGCAFFHWENQREEKSFKVMYKEDSLEVVGVNLLGIRSRHKKWDQWIREKKKLPYVIEHLRKANFDPEFFKPHEEDVREKFNAAFPDFAITGGKQRFLQKLFSNA